MSIVTGLTTDVVIVCSSQLFIELYLDLNHVSLIHQGLNSWVNVRAAKFQFTKDGSVQRVEFNPYQSKRGLYKRYYEAWMDEQGAAPTFGAAWELKYPGQMIETYPGMTVVSTVVDIDGKCRNYCTFMDSLGKPDVFNAARAAYLETAAEDNAVLENIAFDKLMLQELGAEAPGTFHPLLKSGVKQYHRSLRTSPDPSQTSGHSEG